MKKKKNKRLRNVFLVFLLLVIVAGFFGNWYVKNHGYRNLWHFISTAGSNYKKSFSAKYESLEINIKDNDFSKLEALRKKALERGIQINEGDGFVNATLIHNGKKIKAKLRLKGHMTDHLEDQKWSFRIHTKKGNAFMGMKMFSLQNPGTRNYIYEWIYHQLMKENGIIALRYDFIKLKVNGENWGIYAIEENFGQQLVQNNERIKGPIVRFDPELYWVSRINELDKIRINEEYAQMQSAFIDVYDDENVYSDSALLNRYTKAVHLMEAFRHGKMITSEVFDIKKLATFHALIDLVGGHHSIDWSDIKYYYNPESNLLEPVAYESFSVNPTGELCASYKFSSNKPTYINDWHAALFSDPVFFKEYTNALNRVISKKWLDKFFKKIKSQLDNKLATIYNEYYAKELPLDGYYNNQENIKHILAAPSGFITYFKKLSNDTLFLQIGGVDALPYQITHIIIDSLKIKVSNLVIVDPKNPSSCVNYKVIGFPLEGKFKKKINPKTKITLLANVLGHTKINIQKVQMIVYPDDKPIALKYSDLTKFPFFEINNKTKQIICKTGMYEINQTIIIPSGYNIIIKEGTSINFTHMAGIITYSPIYAKGSEDFPINFTCRDSNSGFIALLGDGHSKSFFQNVQFSVGGKYVDLQLSSALRIYKADVELNKCVFVDQLYDALRIANSNVKIKDCQFGNSNKTAVTIFYGNVEFYNTKIVNSKNGLSATGSKISANKLQIYNVQNTGVEVSENSYFEGFGLEINKCKVGLLVSDNSIAKIIGFKLENNILGLKAINKGDVFGPSQISVRNLIQSHNKALQEVEKGSSINIIK